MPAATPADVFTPEDLVNVFDDAEFQAAPYPEKQQAVDMLIREGHAWLSSQPDYGPEVHKDYTAAVGWAREKLDEAKTKWESTKEIAGTIGGVVRDSAATVGAAALDLSPIDEDISAKTPLGGVGTALKGKLGQLGQNLMQGAADALPGMTDDDPIEAGLETLRQELDSGAFPFKDAKAFDGWLGQRAAAILPAQRAWYAAFPQAGTPAAPSADESTAAQAEARQADPSRPASTSDDVEAYTQFQRLDSNPRYLRLMADYAVTRDPAVWSELRKSLLTTPAQASQKRDYRAAMDAQPTKRMLDALGADDKQPNKEGWGNYVEEAGDPFEIAGTIFTPLKGIKAAGKGMKAVHRAGELAKGVAGEVVSELGSQFTDDPNASWSERAETAKQAFYGALGLEGLGAGGKAIKDLRARYRGEASTPGGAINPSPPDLSADPNSNPAAPIETSDPAISTAQPAAFDPNLPADAGGAIEPLVEAAPPGMAGEASIDPLTSPPLTPATDMDPMGTVPETLETLQEQRRRVVSGQRDAMLFPGVTPDQVPAEFQPAQDEGLLLTETEAGTFLHPFDISEGEVRQAVAENRVGHLLGMASAAKPEDAIAAVVQRTADGTEVTAVAVNPETVEANAALLENTASPGDTLTIESPEQVLQQRLNPSGVFPPNTTQAPALSPEMTREERNNAIAAEVKRRSAAGGLLPAVTVVDTSNPVAAMEAQEETEAPLTNFQKAELWADRAIAEGKGKLLSGVPDPTLLAAYAVKASAVVARGVQDFTAWAGEMVKEFGEAISPHLDKLFRQAMGVEDVPLTDSRVPAVADGVKLNDFGQRVKADEKIRESWRETFKPRETESFTEAQLARDVQTWIGRKGGMEGAAQLFFDESSDLKPYEVSALGQQLARGLDERARRAERAGNAEATHLAEAQFQQVIEKLEKMATTAGQALRSFGMWAKLSPRGLVRQVERQTGKARTEHATETLNATPAEVIKEVEATVETAKAKEAAARETKAAVTVKNWIEKLATSQSDTLSWGKAPAISAMEKLARAHMKEIIPDFVDQATALGVPADKAAILDRLIREEHRRSAAIVQAEAEAKLIASLQPRAKVLRKAKVPPFIKAIMAAHEAGLLNKDTFLEAYATAFKLPKFTPEFAAIIRDLAARVEAAPQGSWLRIMAQRNLMAKLAMWEGVPVAEVLLAFWYANVLSGIGTQAVNIYGNAQHLLLKTVQVLGTNAPQQSYRFLQGMLSGAGQGLKQGAAAFVKGVPVVKSADEWQKVDVLEMLWNEDQKTLMGKILAKGASGLGRYVFRALTAADSFFFQTFKEGRAYLEMSRAMEKGKDFKLAAGLDLDSWNMAMDQAKVELQAAGVDRPSTTTIDRRAYEIIDSRRKVEVSERARRAAAEATFNYTPTGPMGVIADALKLIVKGIPPLRGAVPFVNIPANIVDQGLDWTPIGMARAAWGKHLFNNKGQWWTRQERYEKLLAGALGTAGAWMLYGACLGKDGEGDDDESVDFMVYAMGPRDKTKRQQMPPGWKPFTVKIGKRYFSYAESPLSLLLSAVGGALDAQRYATKNEKAIRAAMPAKERYFERFNDVMVAGKEGFFRTGTMSSLDKLFNMSDSQGGTGVAGVFNRTAAGLIPMQGLLRNVAETMDPTVIDTKTFKGAILTNLPMFRSEGQPLLDAFGQNVRNPGAPVLNRFVTPQTSKGPEWDWLSRNNLTISGLDNEIMVTKYLPDSQKEARAALATGGITGLAADRAWRAIEMERSMARTLTPEEATQLQRVSGPIIQNAVKKLRREVDTRQYVPSSHEALQRKLADYVTTARQIGRVRMVK